MSSIEFEQVSKRYQLGGLRGSLREALPNLVRRVTGNRQRNTDLDLWALRDVSFKVDEGEALGIIGPNGAGKTTILKLATSVTQPTSGRIKVNGRLSALIELGAGFHPDLTGRENIYLNGTILGMRRYEIDERFDDIVAFSELEKFLDTPVKRYSSGMYARLGFSVAAHVEPDLLIIDEVLAVGDATFVSKCYRRMHELRAGGTTVILVTHSMGMMKRLCDRAILLYGGQIITEGEPDDVIAAYLNNPEYSTNFRKTSKPGARLRSRSFNEQGDDPVRITSVTFLNEAGQEVESCRTGDSLTIRLEYAAEERIQSPSFEFRIHSVDGTKYSDHNTAWDKVRIEAIEGEGALDIAIDDVVLSPGLYEISLAISDASALKKYAEHRRRYRFQVKKGRPGTGLAHLAHSWKLWPNGQSKSTDDLESKEVETSDERDSGHA